MLQICFNEQMNQQNKYKFRRRWTGPDGVDDSHPLLWGVEVGDVGVAGGLVEQAQEPLVE